MAQLKSMGMDIHQLLTTAVTMVTVYTARRQGSVCMTAAGMGMFPSANQRKVRNRFK